MSRSRFREMGQLIRQCEEQGCRAELTKSNHWKIRTPSGGMVSAPGTASDYRSIKNIRSLLRQQGVKV